MGQLGRTALLEVIRAALTSANADRLLGKKRGERLCGDVWPPAGEAGLGLSALGVFSRRPGPPALGARARCDHLTALQGPRLSGDAPSELALPSGTHKETLHIVTHLAALSKSPGDLLHPAWVSRRQ